MREYPDRPWVAIGVVVHKGDDILLIKRAKAPNKGRWSLPGGAQHIGETLFEGAAREVLEETNTDVTNLRFIDCVDSIYKDDQGKVQFHYSLIEISCEYLSGTLHAQDDAEQAQWVSYDRLSEYDLPQNTTDIIRKSYLSRNASLTEE
ncbi:MAG: NUDIX hydrolase [Methylocystaceae bacterium]|nr:NUDIX hydrolase [Methylocystaceae bacterium]